MTERLSTLIREWFTLSHRAYLSLCTHLSWFFSWPDLSRISPPSLIAYSTTLHSMWAWRNCLGALLLAQGWARDFSEAMRIPVSPESVISSGVCTWLKRGRSETFLEVCRGLPSGNKVSAYNAGDLRSIPGSGRSPGEGYGSPLQYSWLENPMDGGAWWATVHGVAKSQTRLSYFTFTFTFPSL